MAPAIHSKLIKQLSKGTEVSVLELKTEEVKVGKWKGRWVHALIGEDGGWVLDSFLTNNFRDTVDIDGEFEKIAQKYSRRASCCQTTEFQIFSQRLYQNGDAGDSWKEHAIFNLNLQNLLVSFGITYVSCDFMIREVSKISENTFSIKGISSSCTIAENPQISVKLEFFDNFVLFSYTGVSKEYADLSGKFLYGEPKQRRTFDK